MLFKLLPRFRGTWSQHKLGIWLVFIELSNNICQQNSTRLSHWMMAATSWDKLLLLLLFPFSGENKSLRIYAKKAHTQKTKEGSILSQGR